MASFLKTRISYSGNLDMIATITERIQSLSKSVKPGGRPRDIFMTTLDEDISGLWKILKSFSEYLIVQARDEFESIDIDPFVKRVNFKMVNKAEFSIQLRTKEEFKETVVDIKNAVEEYNQDRKKRKL